MSYFEHDFKAHLQAASSVSAIVGEKIFPEVIPQGVSVPAIVYTVIFGEPRNSLDGFTSGLINYQVQVDCWCSTYEQALRLAHAVRDQVNTAYATFKTVIREFPGQSDYEPDTKRYRRMLYLSCWHHE